MQFEDIVNIKPYSLSSAEKEKLLSERLIGLTDLHKNGCSEYAAMLEACDYDSVKISSYKQLPFLPVRLFKDMSLKSVHDDEIVKTMTSSGTSSQVVSRIYLDRKTSTNQQKAMVKIVSDFTGSSRMPMIIVDCPSVIKDRNMFSARGAGILGFSIFGSKKFYALNDDMRLDVEGMRKFLEEHRGEKILLFGFTFMVWQYFYRELKRLKEEGVSFNLSHGILIHGGGWKKLQSEAVDREEFHKSLEDVCGINRIHDYYGMVEQTGCIYMECECGHLHASVFSDVIARRAIDFSECETGEKGILQVVSTIPESYPGHSLLTEDEGVILGEDDCPCGRKGKYFKIIGRLKKAEIRGCSDTFAADRDSLSIDNRAVETEDNNDEIGKILNKVRFLVGSKENIVKAPELPPKPAFEKCVIEFLEALSSKLMKDKEARQYPDIVTLGFWLRRASVEKMKERFISGRDGTFIGRGVAFHISPSNVPVNFAYSLFTGLLCGNANIVRVPSKEFVQVSEIGRLISECLEEYPEMKPYITLVRYDKDKRINDLLSGICDVRIIWGGDQTIEDIRRSPLQPRTTEITFADRYSLAVIDADRYISESERDAEGYIHRVASDFYNDTFLSDQNACTSPRVVIWHGKRKEEAKRIFWKSLHDLVKKKYDHSDVFSVDKLTTAYEAAAEINDIKIVNGEDNLIVRIKVPELGRDLMNHRGKTGFFYEYDADDLIELRDICNDTHCQTIGYLGEPGAFDVLLASGIRGVDRIVPIGRTMDFDLNWDGYNLVEHMTRVVVA